MHVLAMCANASHMRAGSTYPRGRQGDGLVGKVAHARGLETRFLERRREITQLGLCLGAQRAVVRGFARVRNGWRGLDLLVDIAEAHRLHRLVGC